ncbi:TolC family protein, partial [Zeaxanthinibacter enoshimensis]|uniref:TolC family protein n=1 Tax=Zeaxanthinibacter enoshimensis TaxID=392009 RepID=UPI00356B41FB
MKEIIATIVLLTAGLFCVQAQLPLLTKEEAVEQALEHNFGIEVARNQVEIADNNKGILNSGYLPSLSAVAGADYSRDDSTIEFPGQVDDQGNPRPDLEINQAEAQRYTSALQLNYTLFDGLGRLYNYKSLKEQYELTTLQARETIENTMLELFSVYYEIARLSENENVLEEALRISQDRTKRAEYAFEFGQNTKLNILNAEVDVTNDSINLLNTRQQLKNAKRDLNLILNRELDAAFAVDTLIQFTSPLVLQDYIDRAEENNVSVLQVERNLAINEYDIKISKSGYLPRIGLTGSYGWNLNQSAASAFFPGTNNTNNNLSLGASLSWNLFDGGNTAVRIKN